MIPERTATLTIDRSHPDERLDTFLRQKFPALTRGTIQRLIEAGHITVNQKPTKPTHTPRAGEIVQIEFPVAKPAEAQPEDIPLDIIYEDAALLVLNKPAGIVVHPAAGNEEHTLVNALLHHCAGELSGIGGVARPGIVHRLDKETSGCLVVAKNDATHVALSAQFSGRSVEKIYLAILCGQVPKDAGHIHAAIALDMGPPERCAEAIESVEPWVPWDDQFLPERVECYERVGSPHLQRARDDLAEYLAVAQGASGEAPAAGATAE